MVSQTHVLTACHFAALVGNDRAVPPQFGSPLPEKDLSPLIRTTLSYLSNINKLDLLMGESGADQVTSLKVMYETGASRSQKAFTHLVSSINLHTRRPSSANGWLGGAKRATLGGGTGASLLCAAA